MPVNTNISMASAKAALDALVDRLDTGTGSNPRLRIYNGTQPGRPDDAITTQTLLAEVDLGAAAVFGNATTGTGGSIDTATATASAILPKSQTSATASGTASWFRVVNKGTTAIIDGSVGTATSDLILDNTSIATGQTVKINTWKVKLPCE
jgi:hypothetical protein